MDRALGGPVMDGNTGDANTGDKGMSITLCARRGKEEADLNKRKKAGKMEEKPDLDRQQRLI